MGHHPTNANKVSHVQASCPLNFDQLGEPPECRPPAERVIEGDVVRRNWDVDSAKDGKCVHGYSGRSNCSAAGRMSTRRGLASTPMAARQRFDWRPGLQRKRGNRAMSDANFVHVHIKVTLAFALSTVNHLNRLAADTCCQEVGFANPAAAAKDSPA